MKRLTNTHAFILLKSRILVVLSIFYMIFLPVLLKITTIISKTENDLGIEADLFIMFFIFINIACFLYNYKLKQAGILQKELQAGYSLSACENIKNIWLIIICLVTCEISLLNCKVLMPNILSLNLLWVYLIVLVKETIIVEAMYIWIDQEVASLLILWMVFALKFIFFVSCGDMIKGMEYIFSVPFISVACGDNLDVFKIAISLLCFVVETVIVGKGIFFLYEKRIKNE